MYTATSNYLPCPSLAVCVINFEKWCFNYEKWNKAIKLIYSSTNWHYAI